MKMNMKTIVLALLLSSAPIAPLFANYNPALIKALSGVLPQNVRASAISLKEVPTNGITPAQRDAFNHYWQQAMIDASQLIRSCWETVKDLVSENSKGTNIPYYTTELARLHEALGGLIARNDTYIRQTAGKTHAAHQQMMHITQGLLKDLSDAVNVVKSVLANKKQYQRKNAKKLSATKLGTVLKEKLKKYTQRQQLYLSRVGYLWDLTVKAGHSGIVDPLARTVGEIYRDYQNNKKLFSPDHMVVAIQHKLKA